MAAGLGFKNFVTGDVLTAADTNGYLMQGVWVFANAAARTAAVTSPQEGNASFLKDTNALEIYDGAAWVAYGSGDITGVTAGTGISGGGTSGDVTITNSMATAIDAKGDLIAGTGADAFSRLAVGSNNTVLTADSSTATGLKWATPATGGMTQISTGTLSGSSVSLTGLSGYNNLQINVVGAFMTTNGADFYVEVNGSGGAVRVGTFQGNVYGTSIDNAITSHFVGKSYRNANNNCNAVIFIPNYTAAGRNLIYSYDFHVNNGLTNTFTYTATASTTVNAVTSVELITPGTWSGGTYTVFGVK